MPEKNTRPTARLKAINLGETFQVFYFCFDVSLI